MQFGKTCLTSLGVMCCLLSSRQIEAQDEQIVHEMYYHTPASLTYQGWEQESLPIGNGAIGAKLYGLVGEERIQFNEKSVWSGGPREQEDYNGGNFLNRYKYLADIRQSLEEGRIEDAKTLATTQLVGPYDRGYGSYLSFGEIVIDFPEQTKSLQEVSQYKRSLDLNTAITSTTYTYQGTTYQREAFISYPDNVMLVQLTKEGSGNLTFNVTMEQTTKLLKERFKEYATDISQAKTMQTTILNNTQVLLSGQVNDNHLQLAALLDVDTDGSLEVKDEHLFVKNATFATLRLNAQTNYAQNPKAQYRRSVNVVQEVQKVIHQAKQKDYKTLKERHLADYQALFQRVRFNLDHTAVDKPVDELLNDYKNDLHTQALETLFFQYGRYLLIASSRDADNALPANLQGVWNGVDNPPWNSDYHLNVNLQMNYWPAYVTNLSETSIPLINYVDDLRYYGRIAAKEYAGIASREGEENGWLVHTQATPFGWTTPGWSYYWGWSPSANAWIMQNVYEYYRFTQDKTYLEEKIYPMLRETAVFWNQFLHYDKNSDRWVSSPSYSPEHGTITIGNTYDQSLVWELFKNFIDVSELLQRDTELAAQIKEKFAKLKPLAINRAGCIKEWFEEDLPTFSLEGIEANHRHASHLVGLYPGSLFSKEDSAYFNAAKASLNQRGDGGTGWSKANKINLWARLLDGNRAYRLLSEQIKRSTLNNLWDTHPPFQIDGNFGATSGMAEMLLQSHTEYILPLPALPEKWSKGSVSGLKARGNFTFDMQWEASRLSVLNIQAVKGGSLKLDYPNLSGSVIRQNGKEIQVNRISADKISIDTQIGDTIEITYIPERVMDLQVSRTSGGQAVIQFTPIQNVSEYQIVRQDLTEPDAPIVNFPAQSDMVDNTLVSHHQYQYTLQGLVKGEYVTLSKDVIVPNWRRLLDDRHESIRYGKAFENWEDDQLYQGTEKFVDVTHQLDIPKEDVSMTVSFYGTGIKVYGIKSKSLGQAKAWIDDKPVEDAVFYDDQVTQKSVLINAYTNLTETQHTLRLQVDTTPRVNGRNKISLDYFEIIESTKQSMETTMPSHEDSSVNTDEASQAIVIEQSLPETVLQTELMYERDTSRTMTPLEVSKTEVNTAEIRTRTEKVNQEKEQMSKEVFSLKESQFQVSTTDISRQKNHEWWLLVIGVVLSLLVVLVFLLNSGKQG